MDREQYLDRIGYTGEASPTADVLGALQEAHLLAVPFENLDIQRGIKIVLATESLFDKIVTHRRGGFCYELNGLFHVLLLDIGFRTRIVSGRVFDAERNQFGAEFDHMALLVNVENRTWLVDVGFGDFSSRPLEFRLNEPREDATGMYLFQQRRGGNFMISRYSEKDREYIPQYAFSTAARRLQDFEAMCLYHQTSPESHFTRHTVCSIATATGRTTLTQDRLIVTAHGRREESAIGNEREFRRVLLEHFRIML